MRPDRCNPESFEFPPSPLTFSLFTHTHTKNNKQTNDLMWLFYHRLMLNTVLRHSNILASFKSRDNAILNVFIQYQWWFKSEFKGLWIKLTKRFLALCFLLQILDYYFFRLRPCYRWDSRQRFKLFPPSPSIFFQRLISLLRSSMADGSDVKTITWLTLSSIFTHI